MEWNEEKQSWENLTEQEQQMADAKTYHNGLKNTIFHTIPCGAELINTIGL